MNICKVLLLTLVLFLVMTSNVESSNRQSTSSCGDIHNISDPFQLKSNPKRGGFSMYDMTCEDNRTIMYLLDGRYYVLSINYTTGLDFLASLIKVVEEGLQKDNCSTLPHYSLLMNGKGENYYQRNFIIGGATDLVIVNCSKPVSSPFYIATDPCIEGSKSSNTSSYWNLYALVNPKVSDVWDFCTIHSWTWVSYDFSGEEHNNSSSYNYEHIHNIMADGFVLYPATLKSGFFCSFDFYSIYRGQVCQSHFFDYYGGKHQLAMKFYLNIV